MPWSCTWGACTPESPRLKSTLVFLPLGIPSLSSTSGIRCGFLSTSCPGPRALCVKPCVPFSVPCAGVVIPLGPKSISGPKRLHSLLSSTKCGAEHLSPFESVYPAGHPPELWRSVNTAELCAYTPYYGRLHRLSSFGSCNRHHRGHCAEASNRL